MNTVDIPDAADSYRIAMASRVKRDLLAVAVEEIEQASRAGLLYAHIWPKQQTGEYATQWSEEAFPALREAGYLCEIVIPTGAIRIHWATPTDIARG